MRNRPGLGTARGILLAIGAVGTVLAVIVGAVLVGSSSIGPLDVFSIVLHKTLGTPLREGLPETSVAIVWTLRLPRVLVAFAAGAALSVGGCVVQSVLKNPLATPYTLGVSSGASLGAGLVIIFELSLPFAGGFTLPLMGFLCALGTVLLVLVFSSRVDRGMSNLTVILAGMVFSLFFSAVLTVITALARDDKLKQVTLWQMGSFSMRSWSHLGVLLPFLAAGLLMSLWMNKELDILTFGEESAASMGVNTVRAKQLLFLCAALLTGAAVSVCGSIGFVDLVAPHVMRRWFGSRHRVLIPMCAAGGGCLMVAADLAARTLLAPVELPVGAVTAIIGAPFFAYVYFRRRP